MDYSIMEKFLTCYSLPTIIIAVFSYIISFLIKKFILKNISKSIKNYLPIIISIILEFAFDMIFIQKKFCFSMDALYAGLLSGSLSIAISVFIEKIKKGEPIVFNPTVLLIEGLLDGYVLSDKKSQVAQTLSSIINEYSDNNILASKMTAEIIKFKEEKITEAEITSLTKVILSNVHTLSDTKSD